MQEIIMDLLVIGRSLEDKTTRINEAFDNSGWTFLDDEISAIVDIIYKNTKNQNDDSKDDDIKDIIFKCMQSDMSIEDCTTELFREESK